MQRSLLTLGIVGLTAAAAALLFRLLAPKPPDVSVRVDAGLRAKVLDAGVEADAGVAPKQENDLASLPRNPRVKLEFRNESSFATPREALEQLASEQRLPSEYQSKEGGRVSTSRTSPSSRCTTCVSSPRAVPSCSGGRARDRSS